MRDHPGSGTTVALAWCGWIIGLYPATNGVPPELAYRAGFATLSGLALLAVFIYAPIRDCRPRG